MANEDRPRGMWPIRHLLGAQIVASAFKIDTSNTDLITKGDGFIREGDGNIARMSDGGVFLGVIKSFLYTDADGDVHYSDQIPATKTNFTEMTVWGYDDPYIVYGIQADGNTLELDRFATFPIVIANGDVTTKLSNMELDTTGGSGDELKILGKVNTPNNDWGTNVDLEVIINDHAYKAVKAGV